jgi:hypothetical protein
MIVDGELDWKRSLLIISSFYLVTDLDLSYSAVIGF